MNHALAKALKEKEQLQRRLAEIEQFLRLYQEFSGPSNEVGSAANNGNESIHEARPYHAPLIRRGRPGNVVAACRAFLQETGIPLTRGELMEELELKKVPIPGQDRESRARYVGTILWRHHDDFEHVKGMGYWLRGIPIPETEEERRELRERRDL
jgi:hypothetical protein